MTVIVTIKNSNISANNTAKKKASDIDNDIDDNNNINISNVNNDKKDNKYIDKDRFVCELRWKNKRK